MILVMTYTKGCVQAVYAVVDCATWVITLPPQRARMHRDIGSVSIRISNIRQPDACPARMHHIPLLLLAGRHCAQRTAYLRAIIMVYNACGQCACGHASGCHILEILVDTDTMHPGRHIVAAK